MLTLMIIYGIPIFYNKYTSAQSTHTQINKHTHRFRQKNLLNKILTQTKEKKHSTFFSFSLNLNKNGFHSKFSHNLFLLKQNTQFYYEGHI